MRVYVCMCVLSICVGQRPPIPSDCSESLAKLIRECWNGYPQHRPTAAEVVERLEGIGKELLICESEGERERERVQRAVAVAVAVPITGGDGDGVAEKGEKERERDRA